MFVVHFFFVRQWCNTTSARTPAQCSPYAGRILRRVATFAVANSRSLQAAARAYNWPSNGYILWARSSWGSVLGSARISAAVNLGEGDETSGIVRHDSGEWLSACGGASTFGGNI